MKFLIRADAPGQDPCYLTGKAGANWVSFARKDAHLYDGHIFATIACKALNDNKPPCEWAELTYSCEPFDLPAVFLDSEPSSQATMERNPTLPLTINLVSSFGGRQWGAKSNKSALICLGAPTPEEALQSALRTAGFVSPHAAPASVSGVSIGDDPEFDRLAEAWCDLLIKASSPTSFDMYDKKLAEARAALIAFLDQRVSEMVSRIDELETEAKVRQAG